VKTPVDEVEAQGTQSHPYRSRAAGNASPQELKTRIHETFELVKQSVGSEIADKTTPENQPEPVYQTVSLTALVYSEFSTGDCNISGESLSSH
jgi:hypothetical protein